MCFSVVAAMPLPQAEVGGGCNCHRLLTGHREEGLVKAGHGACLVGGGGGGGGGPPQPPALTLNTRLFLYSRSSSASLLRLSSVCRRFSSCVLCVLARERAHGRFDDAGASRLCANQLTLTPVHATPIIHPSRSRSRAPPPPPPSPPRLGQTRPAPPRAPP